MGRILFLALTFALLVLEPMTVWAQSYPTRTVAVIVPFPPGGSVDGVARIIVDRTQPVSRRPLHCRKPRGGCLRQCWRQFRGQSRSRRLHAPAHCLGPSRQPVFVQECPFRRSEGFHAHHAYRAGPLIVSTTSSVPAKNLKEFFDLVRKDPQKYTFATTSFGSASHLVIELLKREAGRRYAGHRL